MNCAVVLPTPYVLRLSALAVLLLNLFDATLTILWVQMGVAEEANPLMAVVLHRGPLLFMLVKVSLVSLCVGILWRYRNRRSAILGLYSTVGVYTVLLGYHLAFARHMLAACW